jgi:hypothetical protein
LLDSKNEPENLIEKAKHVAQGAKDIFSYKTVDKLKNNFGILKKLNKNPLKSVFYM